MLSVEELRQAEQFIGGASLDARITKAERVSASTLPFDGTGALLAATNVEDAIEELIATMTPVGEPRPTMRNTLPTASIRYRWCEGQTLPFAESSFPELWAVCDPIWKSSGSIVLPDLRNRAVFGTDDMDSPSDEGETGGAETHTLSTGEMPTHSHSPSGNSHFILTNNTLASAGGASPTVYAQTASAATATAGGGGAHNNMPPYLRMRWYVRVI